MNEFYRGKSVLITGATGFLGKVLVEKLLRSVPEIGYVFLIIRPQNGADATTRLESLLNSQLFDKVKKQKPESMKKLVPISGDLLIPDLGLSPGDITRLINETSVVFHCAATIKFDEALRISVEMNVHGTQRLLAMSHRMPHLAAFVHASTAYANCDQRNILECVYPPPIKPQKLVEALEWLNEDMVAALTPHLIGKRPNTYTFTKALAEFVLMEESGNLPVIIVRPSIIGAAWREPLPGWVDNLNGPTGLFAAVGNGVLRCMMGDGDAVADLIPVDVVSNLLIASAFYISSEKQKAIPVVNCCSGSLNKITWREIVRALVTNYSNYPMETVFRIPHGEMTMNKLTRDYGLFVDHYLPACIVDLLTRLVGGKPRMLDIHGKLMRAVETLEYFTCHEWSFQSSNVIQLWDRLSPEDQKKFPFDVRCMDWNHYLEMYCIGVKKFMLKQPLSNVGKARKRFRRLQLMSSFLRFASYILVFAFLFRKSGTIRALLVQLLGLLRRFVPLYNQALPPRISV